MVALIVNPIAPKHAEILRAKELAEEFLDYCFANRPDFPNCTAEEMKSAAATLRIYNKVGYFGEALCLWPSDKCIDWAAHHFTCGEVAESFPALKLRRAADGQLYLDF